MSHNDTGVWVCQVRGGAGEVLEAVTRLQVVQEPTITAQTSQVDTSVPQFCHPYHTLMNNTYYVFITVSI